jgi:hypothetical protein
MRMLILGEKQLVSSPFLPEARGEGNQTHGAIICLKGTVLVGYSAYLEQHGMAALVFSLRRRGTSCPFADACRSRQLCARIREWPNRQLQPTAWPEALL